MPARLLVVLSVLALFTHKNEIILVEDLDQQHGFLSYGAGICYVKRIIPVPNSIIRMGSINDCVGDQMIQIICNQLARLTFSVERRLLILQSTCL